MLAGRLIRAVRNILGEYSTFKIIEQLNLAVTASAQRTQSQGTQYLQQARQLRQWAKTVIEQSKIEIYPDDIRKFLNDSNYSSALPSSIARVVFNGFPDDKNLAISSSEIELYVNLASTLRSELGILDTLAIKFNIDQISIPENEISFDIVIPRTFFNNDASVYISYLSRFVKIMSYINEFATYSYLYVYIRSGYRTGCREWGCICVFNLI